MFKVRYLHFFLAKKKSELLCTTFHQTIFYLVSVSLTKKLSAKTEATKIAPIAAVIMWSEAELKSMRITFENYQMYF